MRLTEAGETPLAAEMASEDSPGAVFMPLVNGFVNVSLAYRLIPDLC
jgi:hypothetical protein